MSEPGVNSPSSDDVEDLRVELLDGFAQCMGEGLFFVFKGSDSFVLTADDMRRMLALDM